MDTIRQSRTQLLKTLAYDLGFSFVGVAKAERLDVEAGRLEKWLQAGYHGQMSYMENHFDKRVDPSLLVPGARSVVSLMYNYFTPDRQKDPQAPKISMYAHGEDYHHVVKEKLFTLLDQLRTAIGDVHGRCFVDSAPVMERDWAKRSGLGWIGRHTLLIHPKAGSYFFLAELITDVELVPDSPIRDHCGTCTRCVDACPTEAIHPDGYLLDASKCISYLTIELKEAIPDAYQNQMENWMFGCDICQQVCPWNRFSTPHSETALQATEGLLDLSKEDWFAMEEVTFNRLFGKSAVKRTGFQGLTRNISFLKD